ncbi:MAG TPA: DegT/DnrJ/EryC1/StrS family aminotransferase [Candidatus Polarisedimenticolaceae bacterium]|nr:DegT/DnrJ/EryC1/StrS family aminotransferase [Candidatus Polarisedimenticolaceae bacterium]
MTRSLADRPAVEGGRPVRAAFLPVAAPRVTERQIAEVVDTLRSGWLATGPKTAAFERDFAAYVGTAEAVGLTSGTAALQLALELADVGAGDEVITSPLTYVASAHEIVRRGAVPVFADVDERTCNIDPQELPRRITPRTKALLLVHFGGRPCPMERCAATAALHGLVLLSDSAHSIETRCGGRRLAEWFAASAFSFHPVKNLTTGEGGMLATDRLAWAETARRLRLHGVTRDAWSRETGGQPGYDVRWLGHKCNMSDLQASLGLHQLADLEANLVVRETLCAEYDRLLAGQPGLTLPPPADPGDRHARHLYAVQLDLDRLRVGREAIAAALRAENVGTAHHYPALHRTSYYRERFGFEGDPLPRARRVAERSLTLPLHLCMDESDVRSVAEALVKLLDFYAR